MSKSNLKVLLGNNSITFRLYNTDIVRILKDKIEFNSGGYRTSLTRRTINNIMQENNIPISIFQHDRTWRIIVESKIQLFQDGMQIDKTWI